MRYALIFFLIQIFIQPVYPSPIEIAGEQDGVYEKGDYLVTGDIVVEPGKILTFAAGTVVRFKPYTGMTVKGELICRGKQNDPIVFTSQKDAPSSMPGAGAAQPFDWNGIRVEAGGNIDFAYTKISFSTFGFDIDTNAQANLSHAVFIKNGRASLATAGDVRIVEEAVPISVSWPQKESVSLPGKSSGPAEESSDKKPRKKGAWKLPVRIGFGAIAVAGGAMWAGFHYKATDTYNIYTDKRNVPEADKYMEDVRKYEKYRDIGMIICGAGAVGFGVTFFFK